MKIPQDRIFRREELQMKHWIMFGLTYTVIYFVLAVALAGGGHGTFTFLAPLFTWVLLFIPLFLSNRLDNLRNRVFFVLPILIHYAHTLFFLWGWPGGGRISRKRA